MRVLVYTSSIIWLVRLAGQRPSQVSYFGLVGELEEVLARRRGQLLIAPVLEELEQTKVAENELRVVLEAALVRPLFVVHEALVSECARPSIRLVPRCFRPAARAFTSLERLVLQFALLLGHDDVVAALRVLFASASMHEV